MTPVSAPPQDRARGFRRKPAGWLLALLGLLAAVLLHQLRNLLVPFVLAGGAAAVLDPVVTRLQVRTQAPRWAMAALVFAAALAAAAGTAWWAYVKTAPAVQRLAENPPGEIHTFVARSLGGEHANFFGHEINAQQVTDGLLQQVTRWVGDSPVAAASRWAMEAAFGVVLFFVLLFYGLAQGPDLARAVLNLAPPESRPRWQRLAAQGYPMLQRYFCGIFIIVIFTAVTTWLFAGPIFQLPDAVALGAITGALEILPVIGPTTSMTLLSIVAVRQGGTIWHLAAFGMGCFVLRFGVDQVVGPIVLGRAVQLPPVVVIFAFLAGGALLGTLGVLIAIPVVALAKLALDDYYALPLEPEIC
ncbi:MAG TPA: AI-2E family transporter [Verrucomicrobiae bacterium]|nr:AI-2E family transporter [Verrucomicrobiae bacterium]